MSDQAARRFRVETNTDRQPASQWFETVPNSVCAALNMQAYHAGMGGLYGVYDSTGQRVRD